MADRKLARLMAETRMKISASRLVGSQADILPDAGFFPSEADFEAIRIIRNLLGELDAMREEYHASAHWAS